VPEALQWNAKFFTISESIGAGIDKSGKFIAWHLKDKKTNTFDLKDVSVIAAGYGKLCAV